MCSSRRIALGPGGEFVGPPLLSIETCGIRTILQAARIAHARTPLAPRKVLPFRSAPFHSNRLELHVKAWMIGKFEQSVRETNWLKNDFAAKLILANVVLDQRWLDNVAAVRIIREARNKVAGGRQSDSVSVPLGITTPGQPDIASLWRTVSNQTDEIYFLESSTSPNSFWVPLADLDLNLKEGAPVRS
jgi:hypothetical protein